MESGSLLQTLEGLNNDPVCCVSIDDGEHIVSVGGEDHDINLWSHSLDYPGPADLLELLQTQWLSCSPCDIDISTIFKSDVYCNVLMEMATTTTTKRRGASAHHQRRVNVLLEVMRQFHARLKDKANGDPWIDLLGEHPEVRRMKEKEGRRGGGGDNYYNFSHVCTTISFFSCPYM